MPEVYYVESSFGCGDDATLHVRWNSARLVINLFRNPLPDAKENHLIETYSSVGNDEDEDAYTNAQDAILDAVVAIGESEFDRLAPPPTEPLRQLHAILFPPQFPFRLVTVSGELRLLREGTYLLERAKDPTRGFLSVAPHPNPPSPRIEQVTLDVKLEISDNIDLPRFSTEDIEVVEKLFGDGYISHVRINGREMCAKVSREGREASMQRELDCLYKISTCAAKGSLSINIPKLMGLIRMPHEETVVGVLEEIIPLPDTQELSSLGHIEDMAAISKLRRQNWASQIRKMVDWLHQNKIIWGDGKPDNVLIHPQTDEAWLIDFGGGFTRGWVDESVAETVEGDEQAIKNIISYLQLG